ncbi:class I SAM-dependent methyltransferase [Antricoccus suffuscus]|nr:class I SAM-dependent methyltransferase [Antricoccus suffuscus]
MTNEPVDKTDATEPSTAGTKYADRLTRLSGQRWKQALDVQAPYRRNIQRLTLGKTLDVGCGIGRNLAYLSKESVGVDHNPHSIQVARDRGLDAYTTDEFFDNPQVAVKGGYDALLAAHLVEHMPLDQTVEIMESYLPFLKDGARCVFICPQEMGYKTDDTHVLFADFAVLQEVCGRLGLKFEYEYSFPFPRVVGKVFPYNEFVVVSRKG